MGLKILRTFRNTTGKQKLELIFWIRATGMLTAVGMGAIRILYCFTNWYSRPGFCHSLDPKSTLDYVKNIIGHTAFLYVIGNGLHLWFLKNCINMNSIFRWKLYLLFRIVLDVWGTVLWIFLSISEESESLIGVSFYLHMVVTPMTIVLFGTAEFIIVRHCYHKLNSPTITDIKKIISNNEKDIRECNNPNVEKSIKEPQTFQTIDKRYFVNPLDVNLEYSKFLGGGHYGMVFRGKLRTNETKSVVAIKMLKDMKNGCLSSLVNEIQTFIHAGVHANLVKFYGISSDATNPRSVLLILELCGEGSLVGYLRENSSSTYTNLVRCVLTPTVLAGFVSDVINGMAHLASKGIVHGDLAARNVLLAKHSVRPVGKITDFGLSTKLENYKTYIRCNEGMSLPWKWMSIETMSDFKFSERSDVWAFSVLLWEIYSFGEEPFGNMMWSSNFSEKIRKGLRLGRPMHCPEQIYTEMLSCWDPVVEKRPSFAELKATFTALLKNVEHSSASG